MSPATTTQPQVHQQDAGGLVRLGGWLFRHRTWLPLPLIVALLVLPSSTTSSSVVWGGFAILGTGELLRLWAVRHIGVISRTRSDRRGPLVTTGPFAHVRNPLYLGNVALWTGFALIARVVWLVPILLVLLSLEYHAIVRWEEALLESQLGDAYREYARRVPRWIPAPGRSAGVSGARFSWRETLFSERGTLAAIALGCVLLWIKSLA
jgi:protein-S-isoprenylcysteine O-methyltransferase Ste14